MKVLILAAGYGTRLYPHTKNVPKPLLKVGNRPVIDYILDNIEELEDVSSVAVITNDRFFNLFQDWKNNLKVNFPISIINDLTTSPDDRLGAIGDMHFAFNKEGCMDDYLVLGGDNLFRGSLRNFISFARQQLPFATVGLCDIGDKSQASHYGVVSLNGDCRLLELCEKPAEPQSSLIAMCLYYLPKEKLHLIKEYLNNPLHSHDTAGSYINWLCSQDKVYGFIFEDLWFDIGHIDTYKMVEGILKEEG